MDDVCIGKTYGAGVTLATTKKQENVKLTAADINSTGTPKKLLWCAN